MKTKLFTSNPLWPGGIFIVRIFTGIMIIPHGQELFDANRMKEMFSFLNDIKFPLATPLGYLAKISEFFGGILIIAGLFTRIVTIPLMITMCVVIKIMGGGNIFNDTSATLFFLLFLGIFFTGPGKWSLDYLLFDRKNKLKNPELQKERVVKRRVSA